MKNISKLGTILREWWDTVKVLFSPIYKDPYPYVFEHPSIKEYMDRLPQVKKEADARVDKIIATTVVKFSMSKMGMSKEEALQAAREAVAYLRDVRAKKLLKEGKITEEGYELYNRLIHSAWVKGAVKASIKHTGQKVKVILGVLMTKTPLKVIKPVIEVVDTVIPEEVKKAAKEKAKELLIKAVEEFPKVVAPMVEKGYKVAKKVKETITTGVQKAIEKGKAFVESHPVVKTVVTGLKKTIEKIPLFSQLKKKLKKFSFA